ncbi:MAG: response regulator, partial [Chloroflexota bacterium]
MKNANQGNILFIDDDKNFLDTRAIFLRRAGYTVFDATNLDDAMQILADRWIHLIIIDVRLEDPHDEHDKSGIEFVKLDKFSRIPKVVITAYPTFEDTREVLRKNVEGESYALDYIDKEVSASDMIEQINEIFKNHVGIAKEITLIWKHINPLELVGQLSPESRTHQVGERIAEVEGLFKTLFRDYERVIIEQVVAGVAKHPPLVASAFRNGGGMERYLVQVRSFEIVERERVLFQKIISQNGINKGDRATDLAHFESTPRYGAAAWHTKGFGRNLFVHTFQTLIAINDYKSVEAIVNRFCLECLTQWHGPQFNSRQMTWVTYFNLEDADLTAQINQLYERLKRFAYQTGLGKFDYGVEEITLKPIGSDLIPPLNLPSLNPMIKTIFEHRRTSEQRLGVVHGALGQNTIFFNGQNE